MGDSLISELFHKKWVWAVLVVDVLIILTIVGLNIFNSLKTVRLELYVAPVDATVTINGKEYEEATYAFMPGHYEINISHADLGSKSFENDLESGHYLKLATFLKDDNFEYYTLKDNYVSFSRLAEIAGAGHNITIDNDTSAEDFIKKTTSLYDALSLLPIDFQEYMETVDGEDLVADITVKESDSDDCATFLCIEALMVGAQDKNIANRILEEKGFNLEDYEILYTIY